MNVKKRLICIFLSIILVLESSNIANASHIRTEHILLHDYITPAQEQEELVDHGVYTLKYYLNNGKNSWLNVMNYTKDQLPIFLHSPSRDGFSFGGWYTDSNYSHKIETITQIGTVSLYAKWLRSINNTSSVDAYHYKTNFLSGKTTVTLKSLNYTFLKKVDIPGMPGTISNNFMQQTIAADNQIPQGIALTKEFILITAYSSISKKNPGSLYIFNREHGEYLSTIRMKAGSHLGGIAYDGENVWVCHSENWTLEKIPYYYIQKAAKLKIGTSIDVSNASLFYKIKNRPSCVTFHKGKLFVATQSPFFDSEMVSYTFNGKKLTRQDIYRIPKNVQGVTFNDEDKVYLSTSLGRKKSSYLRIYNSLSSMNKNTSNTLLNVEMPPCSEELDIYDEKLYIVFESAGAKYFEGTDGHGASISPINKILSIKLNSL